MLKKKRVNDFMHIWELRNYFNFGNWEHHIKKQKLEKRLLLKINMKTHSNNVFLAYCNRI